MLDSASTDDSPRGIADSPWFWLFLFGGAAIFALIAVGPKYERRQAKLETKFEGREQAWRNQQAAPAPVADDRAPEPATAGRPSAPHVSLRSLALLLAAVLCLLVVIRAGLRWRTVRTLTRLA